MKNLPSKIYLQLGPYPDLENDDFKDLSEVTWCEDKIDENDPAYIRADLIADLIQSALRIQPHLAMIGKQTEALKKLKEDFELLLES